MARKGRENLTGLRPESKKDLNDLNIEKKGKKNLNDLSDLARARNDAINAAFVNDAIAIDDPAWLRRLLEMQARFQSIIKEESRVLDLNGIKLKKWQILELRVFLRKAIKGEKLAILGGARYNPGSVTMGSGGNTLIPIKLVDDKICTDLEIIVLKGLIEVLSNSQSEKRVALELLQAAVSSPKLDAAVSSPKLDAELPRPIIVKPGRPEHGISGHGSNGLTIGTEKIIESSLVIVLVIFLTGQKKKWKNLFPYAIVLLKLKWWLEEVEKVLEESEKPGNDQPERPEQPDQPDQPEEPTTHLNIVTIGKVGDGKATLTAAITKTLAVSGGAESVSYDSICNATENAPAGITVKMASVEYKTDKRRYTHVTFRGHEECVKSMITGAVKQLDGAIIVVSAADFDDERTQFREQISLARDLCLPSVVVFINKVDLVSDSALMDEVEEKIRNLLSSYEFPGEEVRVIRGSALKALNSQNPKGSDCNCIRELMKAVDDCIQESYKPFLMPIEDAYNISGQGTFVTGIIERGAIENGDSVQRIGMNKHLQETSVKMIETDDGVVDRSEAGDSVKCLLGRTNVKDVEKGQVIAEPDSVASHTKFKGKCYVFTKNEGGASFSSGDKPIYCWGVNIPGTIEILEGKNTVNPGDNNVTVSVELTIPVAMDKGFHFLIKDGDKTVCAGVVTEIIDE